MTVHPNARHILATAVCVSRNTLTDDQVNAIARVLGASCEDCGSIDEIIVKPWGSNARYRAWCAKCYERHLEGWTRYLAVQEKAA